MDKGACQNPRRVERMFVLLRSLSSGLPWAQIGSSRVMLWRTPYLTGRKVLSSRSQMWEARCGRCTANRFQLSLPLRYRP